MTDIRTMRWPLGLAAMVAATVALAAPAAAQTKMTFLLNVPPAGYNAGFELAVEKGYYKEAGLDVTIEPGNGSQTTAQLISVGKYDIGFADSAPVMKLISQGAKVKIIATILQGNPNAVTALKKTGLKSVADMKGKSVAMPNAGSQSSMFPLVLAANNLKESDIKLVNMPPQSMVASLIQGTVEVILGSVDQYDIQLKNQGQEFDSYLFIDSGAPTVSTSIIASDEFLAKNPDAAKKFVAASLKGWYATLDNQAEAVERDEEDVPGLQRETGAGADRRDENADVRQPREVRRQGDARPMGGHREDLRQDRRPAGERSGHALITRMTTCRRKSQLRSCPLK